MKKNLHSLLKEVGLTTFNESFNPLITGISCDSRHIEKGDLFIGIRGVIHDGGRFWSQALSAGASAAVISSAAAKNNPPPPSEPVIILPEIQCGFPGEIASAFWEYPSRKMSLIGVTGTNGKTTTTYLIEHLAKSFGKSTALFGTLVNRWPGNTTTSIHTTNFADKLQAQLAKAIAAGAEITAMEVSSHSLSQSRVAGCDFSGAVFTNLTQDHLDYHHSMNDYFEAKALLFSERYLNSSSANVVVNVDDLWGKHLSERLGDKCWRSSLSQDLFESGDAELTITQLEIDEKGAKGLIHTPVGVGGFSTRLIGNFNLMNLLQSVGVLVQVGLPFQELLKGIPAFEGVPGRMERVPYPSEKKYSNFPTVIVDYAHTPDGLKNALNAARSFVKGELICVFGCGGDRDRGKRSQMGSIAFDLSDQIVVTSDNPRNEEPERILNDILNGIPNLDQVRVETDRSKAIRMAILDSSKGDVVLVAGKGHEDYQIIGDEKKYFDDKKEVQKAFLLKSNR